MLYHGDCFNLMPGIATGSVAMILCDPPYGTVNWASPQTWDKQLNFDRFWPECWRVLKKNGVIAVCGNEPFSTIMKFGQLARFKYDYVWVKTRAGGFANAKVKPLKKYELVSIFSEGTTSPGRKNNMPYYPQGLQPLGKTIKPSGNSRLGITVRENAVKEYVQEFTNYPGDVLEFDSESGLHPTQKPVALFERMIRTYTQEGETVLDMFAGSGTTAVAAERAGRKWICMEREKQFVDVINSRISAEAGMFRLCAAQ